MAGGNTITNKIVLEGEAAYKKSLDEINRSLKESKSALKAAAAEYDGAGDSMVAMYKQGDALERVLRDQESALRLMEGQLDKVEGAYGRNSREATELRTKINNMRTEMARTETQIRQFETRMTETADATQETAESMEGAESGFERLGESAKDAQADVDALGDSVADAVGQKIIEFTVGGAALNSLKDAMRDTIAWAIQEGVDGAKERGYLQAGTGDETLTQARLGVKDGVDKRWSGRLDGMATASAVETVDTVMDNSSLTDPELVERVTNAAIFQQERFGAGVGDQMERADAMVKTFSVDWMTAFDLMTLGFQNSHDGGQLMLKTFDENAQTFRQMGYDADDMFSVILNAVNSEELGKDSNLNKGMLALVKSVTGGGKEAKETLEALGILSEDIGVKAQAGGDTAAAAYRLVLESLMSVTDEATRNSLGKALFGDNVWTSTGGDIATALLAGFGQEIEADGTTDAAMNALLDNVEDNFAGLKERAGQAAGAIAEPLVVGANNAIKALNEGIDEGDMLSGLGHAVIAWGDGLHALIDPAIANLAQSVEEKTGELSQGVSEKFFGGAEENVDEAAAEEAASRWIDKLRSGVEGAAAEGQQSEALKAMLKDMLPDTPMLEEDMKTYAESHKAAVVAQLETAYGQGTDEDFAAWQAFQKALIGSAYEDTTTDAAQLGDDAVQAEIDSMLVREGDVAAAGEQTGDAAVDGFEAGTDNMEATSRDSVNAAVFGLKSGIAKAWAAGWETGKAYEQGYKAALDQHSPSRVMEDDAHDTVDGLLEGFRKDEARLYEAAAGMGEIVSEGMMSGGYAGGATPSAYGGMDTESMAAAMREALVGLAWDIDGERFATLIEPGVSQETSRRAAATVRGQASKVKGW